MFWPTPQMISVPLTVARRSPLARVPARADCLSCRSSLKLYQPDINAPHRLLGTCDRCGRWHLIDREGFVVVLLPDLTEICDAGAVH